MATWQKIAFEGGLSKRTLNWDLHDIAKYGAKGGYVNVCTKSMGLGGLGSYGSSLMGSYFRAIPWSTDGGGAIDQDGALDWHIKNWDLQTDDTGVDESCANFSLAALGSLTNMTYDGSGSFDDHIVESIWDSVLTVPNGLRAEKKHVFSISGFMTNESLHLWDYQTEGFSYLHVQIWRAYMPETKSLGYHPNDNYDEEIVFRLVNRSVHESTGNAVVTAVAPMYKNSSTHWSDSEIVVNLDGAECASDRASYYILTWFVSDESDDGADATAAKQFPDPLNAAVNSDTVSMNISVGVTFTPAT